MADDEQMDLKKYEEGGYEKQGGSSFWNAEKVGDVLEGYCCCWIERVGVVY